MHTFNIRPNTQFYIRICKLYLITSNKILVQNTTFDQYIIYLLDLFRLLLTITRLKIYVDTFSWYRCKGSSVALTTDCKKWH